MTMKLTNNQELALALLRSKTPGYVSPTEVGRTVGTQIGKPGSHSSFGSPLCKKLVTMGLAERNESGHYRAVIK